ncbi:hypothetical protein, partial [Streptomyces sp. NRRL F-5135]|uniref:hypothetical protein n=1 Tax=Streptomyces sp. NRRL F-5135 TaxID=1463858 RepID=UPI0004C7FDCC
LDLDAIEARAQAATPGPWGQYHDGSELDYIDIAADLEETDTGFRCRRQIAVTVNEPIDNDPTHRDWTDEQDRAQIHADAAFIVHARQDVPALLAAIRRLQDRVTELEGPAVHARAALAALCYDLEDPGSNALGALHLLSQATVGVDAPKDDAAAALAQRDAQVMRRCAEFVRDTYSGDWAD